jgi:hypothetical protein
MSKATIDSGSAKVTIQPTPKQSAIGSGLLRPQTAKIPTSFSDVQLQGQKAPVASSLGSNLCKYLSTFQSLSVNINGRKTIPDSKNTALQGKQS